jgi:hypothetical protein
MNFSWLSDVFRSRSNGSISQMSNDQNWISKYNDFVCIKIGHVWRTNAGYAAGAIWFIKNSNHIHVPSMIFVFNDIFSVHNDYVHYLFSPIFFVCQIWFLISSFFLPHIKLHESSTITYVITMTMNKAGARSLRADLLLQRQWVHRSAAIISPSTWILPTGLCIASGLEWLLTWTQRGILQKTTIYLSSALVLSQVPPKLRGQWTQTINRGLRVGALLI